MGTVLYSLRAQLPQTVRALSLDLQQSWFRAGQAWTELARLTALTKLTITFGHKVGGCLSDRAVVDISARMWVGAWAAEVCRCAGAECIYDTTPPTCSTVIVLQHLCADCCQSAQSQCLHLP